MIPLKILSIRKNSKISHQSKIYPFSIISSSKIDSYSYVSYFCKINNTTIGKFCSIGQNVKMGLGKHPTNYLSTSPLFYSDKNPLNLKICIDQKFVEFEPIIIGNDVWIGTNVTVLDGVNIGDGAIIGANSLVAKDVPPYSIMGGVPAKEIKKRFDFEIIDKLLNLKWWNYSIETIKKELIFELFSKEINISDINELEIRLKEGLKY